MLKLVLQFDHTKQCSTQMDLEKKSQFTVGKVQFNHTK